MENQVQKLKENEKLRGTSTGAMVCGILGGILHLPSILCASMCATIAGAGAIAASANNAQAEAAATGVGLVVVFIVACAVLGIVSGCLAKSKPKFAGFGLILATLLGVIVLVISGFSIFSLAGIILTLIGAILAFVQKKEVVTK